MQNQQEFLSVFVPRLEAIGGAFRDDGLRFGRILFNDINSGNTEQANLGIRTCEFGLGVDVNDPINDLVEMAFNAYIAGDYQATAQYILAASGLNMETFQAAARWNKEQQMDFALFLMEKIDIEYLRNASYGEQLRTIFQVFNQYLQTRHIEMEMADVITSVVAISTAINGELKNADAATMENLWNAGSLQEIFAAATFLNFAEREAVDNFVTGPPQPMALASPAEQYAAMLAAYFEEIKEMGWRRTREEKDAEEHAKEMQHLSSEAEEIKQKFVAELKAMGDIDGLAALANGYEGDGMSASAWRSFWTPERAEAFRKAIRNA